MWHADTACRLGEFVDVQYKSQRTQIEHLGEKMEGEKKAQTCTGMKQRHPFKNSVSTL